MRYFYYTIIDSVVIDSTVIIVDPNSQYIETYPHKTNYSNEKSVWMEFYHKTSITVRYDVRMFEICENQFKKFKEHGTIPIDWSC